MNVELHGPVRTPAPAQSVGASRTTVAIGPASEASLLPSPGSAGLDATQDAMAMMYSLVSQQGNQTLAMGEASVTAASHEQATEALRQEQALKQEEADEANMNCGSLFGAICNVFSDVGNALAAGRIGDACGDAVSGAVSTLDSPHLLTQLEQLAPQVAEYVGVAAAVVGAGALTASTGGAGGIAVAAVVIGLSASGMLAEKTGCFGKDSAYIGMGLEVAGAVVSFGASSAMVADSAIVTASAAVDAASGTSDVLAGASTVAIGEQQAGILDDTGAVQQAGAALTRNARIVSDIVTGLKDAQQSNKGALAALASAAQTYGQTLTLAAAGTKA